MMLKTQMVVLSSIGIMSFMTFGEKRHLTPKHSEFNESKKEGY